MTYINKIKFQNFRNFISTELSFNNNCNILYGDNGSGKTNILEGISLLYKGRGFKNSKISDLIFKNEDKFIIFGEVEKNENKYDLIVNSIKDGLRFKKEIHINNDKKKSSLDFIYSAITYLFFLPEMERLFIASPNYRRNFIDRLIFSVNKDYNKLINLYKKNLLERSKLLISDKTDKDWIEIIEKEISKYAIQIYNLREHQINILNKYLKIIKISENFPFEIELKLEDKYFNKNQTTTEYFQFLSESRNFDKKFGGSKIGPHKSDITATINKGFDASKLSTGQQKTLVLMILIAQCSYLINEKGTKPILLFDEICSHLDSTNRKILLNMTQQFDAQFFFTGTEKSLFSFMSTNTSFYNITDL